MSNTTIIRNEYLSIHPQGNRTTHTVTVVRDGEAVEEVGGRSEPISKREAQAQARQWQRDYGCRIVVTTGVSARQYA